MTPSAKRNLILVRAGPTSLHPSWLMPADQRNWDMIVNYFGDDPDQFRDSDIPRIDSKSTKWPAIQALLQAGQVDWEAYDYVWFPDDDLAFDGLAANRMFDVCREATLDLSQPSLSWTSHFSHLITVHNASFSLRMTNFVEVMAPCFSRELLRRCVETFSESVSGWGLDFVWPRRVSQMGGRCAVIDEVQVTHTRPVGGPTYAALAAAGISPQVEFARALERHGIVDTRQIVTYGTAPAGEAFGLLGSHADRFLGELAAGWAGLGRGYPLVLGRLLREHVEFRNGLLAR